MGSKKENIDIGSDKQVIRGSGLIGPLESGVPTLIDVKDGKITRIRPLNYEMNYDREEFNAWKIEARGKTFEPPMKGVVGPIGLAYKKRVYSKNRVRYPLKRVDWDDNSGMCGCHYALFVFRQRAGTDRAQWSGKKGYYIGKFISKGGRFRNE
jgi:hypothetical protein